MFIKAVNDKNKLISVAQVQELNHRNTNRGMHNNNIQYKKRGAKYLNDEKIKLEEEELEKFDLEHNSDEFKRMDKLFFKVSVINEITVAPQWDKIVK